MTSTYNFITTFGSEQIIILIITIIYAIIGIISAQIIDLIYKYTIDTTGDSNKNDSKLHLILVGFKLFYQLIMNVVIGNFISLVILLPIFLYMSKLWEINDNSTTVTFPAIVSVFFTFFIFMQSNYFGRFFSTSVSKNYNF